MEFKHACKLCDRKFANGKSMGGHMRSHFVKLLVQPNTSSPHPSESLYAPNPSELLSMPKTITTPPKAACASHFLNLESGYAHGSRSHFASSGTLFSAAMELGVRTSARKRSKRTHPQLKGMESARLNAPLLNPMYAHFFSPDELVTVEDVALCLIMLSKDKWPEDIPHPKVTTIQSDSDDVPKDGDAFNFDENDADADDDDDDSSDSMDLKVFGRRCEICKKVFKSYQALGGHMRNHKRSVTVPALAIEKKEFPCKICLRVFPSGQALGGHKKVHLLTEKKPVGNPLTKNKRPVVEVDSASESDSGSSFASTSTSGNDEASSDTDNYYNGAC